MRGRGGGDFGKDFSRRSGWPRCDRGWPEWGRSDRRGWSFRRVVRLCWFWIYVGGPVKKGGRTLFPSRRWSEGWREFGKSMRGQVAWAEGTCPSGGPAKRLFEPVGAAFLWADLGGSGGRGSYCGLLSWIFKKGYGFRSWQKGPDFRIKTTFRGGFEGRLA